MFPACGPRHDRVAQHGPAPAGRSCRAERRTGEAIILDAAQILPLEGRSRAQRAIGTLLLHSKAQAGSGAPVLGDLRHSGCLKALFPRGPADRLSAVIVNTSGGITGGDDLRIAGHVGGGSRLSLTSQAAERIYRASGSAPARVNTTVSVAAGGRLDWLPQETILFDAARLDRRLRVDLAGDAGCLLVETLVFGRTAMGERVHQLHLSDRIEVWRDDLPLFIDRMRLSGDAVAHLARRATGGGAVALASVLLATPPGSAMAAAHLAALRPGLPAGAGISLIRPGLLFLRLTASDSFNLRRTLLPLLARLNDGPLPRTWMI
jgi:urease accessory protein